MNDPFDHQNIFSLILSLHEQSTESTSSPEELTNKFERLSRLALGEMEFARRMGFEKVPCMRIAPYPELWQTYKQPVNPDFIITYQNQKLAVDVKFFNKTKLEKELIISADVVSRLEKFTKYHQLDGGAIAIKRYETWYLINVHALKKLADKKGNHYYISFDELAKVNLLKEKHLIFNTGISKSSRYNLSKHLYYEGLGIVLKDMGDQRDKTKFNFKFSENARYTPDDNYEITGLHAQILHRMYDKMSSNCHELLRLYDGYGQFAQYTDVLPTPFSLADGIGELNTQNTFRERFLNHYVSMKVIYCEPGEIIKNCFDKSYNIITHFERQCRENGVVMLPENETVYN